MIRRADTYKLTLLGIILFIAVLKAAAQNPSPQSPKELLLAIQKSKPDTNQVKLLQRLGGYYLKNPGRLKHGMDSAMNNFNAASKLSQRIGFKKGELNSTLLVGDWYLASNDFDKGKSYYIKVVNAYHATGDKLNEAMTWDSLGGRIMYNDAPHQADREKSYKNAYDLFNQVPGKQMDALLAYKDVADALLNEGRYKLAETELLDIAGQFEHMRYAKLYQTYYLLAEVYRRTHNFQKELFYRIECVKGVDNDPVANPIDKLSDYHALALLYGALKDLDQCLSLEKKALEVSKNLNFFGFYTLVTQIIYALWDSKNPAAVLSFLRSQEQIYPPKTDLDKRAVAELTLRLNLTLKRYDEVGKAIPKVIELFVKGRQNAGQDNGYTNHYSYVLTLASNYYLTTHQNDMAALMVDSVLSLPLQKIGKESMVTIYTLCYKIDSIKGDFKKALEHYKKAAILGDSINYYAKNEQIARMYASYKTLQKEKSIQELNKKNSAQQTRLQRARVRQNFTIGAVVMFFIIAVVAFIGFRNKQISNRKLMVQQMKINHQNDSLNRLLKEKEWLLKEVHHRVKNNLHTVICLLESQAAYLENDALKAIENSQHRIYAMSLIHQQLYQSDDIKTIDMGSYIPELVKSLADSFDVSNRIQFKLNINPVNLEISHAIPLGLIINEAITNSIKYAFPDNRHGEISILLIRDGDRIKLELADNGIGMPETVRETESGSLGLVLMKGLSEDIDADIDFEIENGTKITIKFKPDTLNAPQSTVKLADTKEMYL